MSAISSASPVLGLRSACNAIGLPRATFYRRLRTQGNVPATGFKSHRALSTEERQRALDHLHAERFVDKAPAEVYSILLDEGAYLCSVRTMYRILDQAQEVKDRRRQRSTRNYKKPELLATAPNQVWSWDITKLKGPMKWNYFYLYVIIDIFSRYVVGWMVADRENSIHATNLIGTTAERQSIVPGTLTLHSDRGAPMKSKTTSQLLADLSITKSLSRPSISNDNPYSEAHFKTVKHNPWFPEYFGSIQDATSYCRMFFNWYNNEHRHSGISFVTPYQLHYGLAQAIIEDRKKALNVAYELHPERFVNKPPTPAKLPSEAWINPPARSEEATG